MTEYVVTPNAEGAFLALSRTKSGRMVRKEILKTGPLNYPGIAGGSVELTNDMFDQIVANFDSKVCDIVQFPMVDDANKHSESPLLNAGEVVKLQHEGDSLFAYIDVRKPEVAKGIVDKTVIGASAMLALNYTDTRTGKPAGPTLLHVAGTNRPHVVDLEGYEVIAASVDSNSEVVVLSAPTDHEETHTMVTKDEAIAFLKDEHGIDVTALQAQVAEPSGVAELSAQLSTALSASGIITLSNGDTAKAEDLVLAVGQLASDKIELSGRLEALELSAARASAEAEVDGLIKDGFLAESTRAAQVELKLSNPEIFATLVPEQPIIKLSGEAQSFIPADSKPSEVVQNEIDRYSAIV